MPTRKWTFRAVRPSTVRVILQIISEKSQAVKWDSVWNEAMTHGLIKEKVSNARTWHYSSLIRCLGLAITSRAGWYELTPLGREFLSANGTGEAFSEKEVAILRRGLFHCEETRRFLGFFAGRPYIDSLQSLMEDGRPVYCHFQRSFGVVENSFGFTRELKSRTEVNQWQDGLADFCKQLRVIDELRIPPGTIPELPSNHIWYPVRDQKVTPEWIETILACDHRLKTHTGRIYIPRLLYVLATEHQLRLQEVKDALIKYIAANKSRVYLDRVSELSVRHYESSFLQFEGVWRSSIVYG